jgi:hypothetical protein
MRAGIKGVAAITIAASVGAAMSAPAKGGMDSCSNDSQACVIAASTTYLDALVTHSAARVAFAPNVHRTENGIDTGDGAEQIRSSLETDPRYQVIKDVRDVRWVVDGDQAVAFYLIDTGAVPGLTAQSSTAHVFERFTVRDGLIEQIEAVFCFAGGPGHDSARQTSVDPALASLCMRLGPVGA